MVWVNLVENERVCGSFLKPCFGWRRIGPAQYFAVNLLALSVVRVSAADSANTGKVESSAYTSQLQCFGEPFRFLSLEPEFPHQFKDQGAHGTCYAQSATQVVEAGLFRQTGRATSLSAEYAAATYCAKPARLKKTLEMKRLATKYGQGEPEKDDLVLDGGDEGEAIDEILGLQRYPLDSPAAKLAFDKTSDEAVKKVHEDLKGFVEYRSYEKNIEELNLQLKAQTAALDDCNSHLKFYERDWTTSTPAERAGLNAQIEKWTKKAEAAQKSATAIYEKLGTLYGQSESVDHAIEAKSQGADPLREVVCDGFKCYRKKVAAQGTVQLADLKKKSVLPDLHAEVPKTCTPQQNLAVIGKLLEPLCLGIPVTIGLNKGVTVDSEQFFKPGRSVLEGGHAVVLQGVERDAQSQKMMWIFRNSYGGSSYLKIPFEDSCKISGANAVINTRPLKNEKISEQKAFSDKEGARQLYLQRKKARWFVLEGTQAHGELMEESTVPASAPVTAPASH